MVDKGLLVSYAFGYEGMANAGRARARGLYDAVAAAAMTSPLEGAAAKWRKAAEVAEALAAEYRAIAEVCESIEKGVIDACS